MDILIRYFYQSVYFKDSMPYNNLLKTGGIKGLGIGHLIGGWSRGLARPLYRTEGQIMKMTYLVTLCIISVTGFSFGSSKTDDVPFKSLKVVSIERRVIKGPEKTTRLEKEITQYIDVVKNRFRTEEVMVKDILPYEKKVIIFDGKNVYHYFPEKKSANLIEYPPQLKEKISWRSDPYKGAKHIRDERILGRLCRVFKSENLEAWYWHGILLKHKTSIPRTEHSRSLEPKKVEENIKLPDDMFKLPKNTKILSSSLEDDWKGRISDAMERMAIHGEKSGK